MKLYFTAAAKINPEHSVLFNQMAINIQKIFTELMDSVSRQNKDSIDWWVSSPASRNTLSSPLFHYCCCIALLQELIRAKKPITEIVTDSKAFKRIIEDYLIKQKVNAEVTRIRLSPKQRLKGLVWPIYTIFGLPLKQVLFFFVAKSTRSSRKPIPADPLILIDTFVMNGFIEKDRYYPGLKEALSEEEKKAVWFVPQFYGFHTWQYLSVLKRMRKADRNFILKDEFLKFVDYWCLWQHLFRVRKLTLNSSFLYGVDISPLVREELTDFHRAGSSYAPLLNYCFTKRLKKAGVKLRLIIDWFENQNIDRGWNAGFRCFFPDVETIGYQGFIESTHYLCMYPTEEEKNNRVIPQKMAVIGKGLVKPARRFCSDLDVFIAPAFRFQHVLQERKYFPAENLYTILVALPIMISEAVNILKLLAHEADEGIDDFHFWIKPHPTASQLMIKTAFGDEWPEQFRFVAGDFNDCLEKSNLLISSASSTCMETLAKGIPVIVVGNNSGLTRNPIPEIITEDIWSLCHTHDEITEALQFYKRRNKEKIKEHEIAGRRIKEEYFEPVTPEAVRNFLGFNK